MKNIRNLIKDLNWNKSEEVQQNAMKQLSKINEEVILLADLSNEVFSKSCWHNAALVLKIIGYPRIELAIPYLMEWFQDVNWPGVQTVVDIFKSMDTLILLPYLENAARRAIEENDELWAYGLVYLMEQLNISQSDFNEKDIYNKIKRLSD